MGVSITVALAEAAAELKARGISDARLDASVLLGHTTRQDRTFLIAHGDVELSPGQLQKFQKLVIRRADGEPLQYLTGRQEFFKLDFEVTPDVLIPRPETELIVEAVLDLFPTAAAFDFADAGTGS